MINADSAISLRSAGITGVGDETIPIQNMLDSLQKGSVLEIKDLDVFVSKNTLLTGYPNNDQPCLVLRDKEKIIINVYNSSFRTLKHAQGILEIVRCKHVIINNLTVIGAGNFPPIDGITGRAEKGTSTEGFYTAPIWGYYKNNSYDTSSRNTGGFGGAFPRYGGGTGSTWGIWNEGYIGNVSYGILINNDCEDITLNGCKASGFNYVGLGVGHNGNFFPTNLQYGYSKRIKFIDCEGIDNYSAGAHSLHCEYFTILRGTYSDNGHPDSNPATHNYCDPGYGYTSRGSDYYTKGGLIQDVRAQNNKRKGIDSHAGENISIMNNYVQNNPVCGIFLSWSSPTQKSKGFNITANYLDNNGYARGALGSIYVGGDTAAEERDCASVIMGNIIDNYATAGIRIRYADNVDASKNILRNSRAGLTAALSAIAVQGNSAEDLIKNITVIGNKISDKVGAIVRGIQTTFCNFTTVRDNNIEYFTAINIGLYAQSCQHVDFFGNKVKINDIGTPIAIAQTLGYCEYNTSIGGNSASFLNQNSDGKERLKPLKSIVFRVSFNGTPTPSITKYAGGDHVLDVTPDPAQLKVNLSGIDGGTINLIPLLEVVSSTGIKTNSNHIDNIKVVGISKTIINIEFKESTNTSSPRINPATILTGELNVIILIN